MTDLKQIARPPLVEAAIEFRVSDRLSEPELGRLDRRYNRKAGWSREELFEITTQIHSGGSSHSRNRLGARFRSMDGNRIVTLTHETLGISCLAPYPGWSLFLEDVRKQYTAWRKIVGRRRLMRIGVRYINRIDIPFAGRSVINYADYVNFQTGEPAILNASARAWAVQVNSGIIEDNLDVNLGCASMESPLLDHVSIALDIDVFRGGVDVPQDDDDIWGLLELIRNRRTEIFHSCLKPETLALIS